ncbi:DUF6639 family protein [Cereibacter sediminicola]|uniref:DUF6639 family protein n=1 Tax=Cereibacter sediminicola TaxID=2584941 RepID=UPI001FE4ADE4|nr:DUF6639 family protein [Cereibacter sediminicola]
MPRPARSGEGRGWRIGLIVLLLALTTARPAAAACGLAGVSVSGSAEEIAEACEVLAEVTGYFRALGFSLEPEVTVVFADRIEIELPGEPSGAEPTTGTRAEISGCYDFRQDMVCVVSGHRGLSRDRQTWGLDWSPPVARSILTHELVHATVSDILGPQSADIGMVWHEFIAYAVQFHLMPPALRAEVLERHPDVTAFATAERINPMTYAMDPEAFAISAFLFAEEQGGGAFIRQLLTGSTPFSTEEFQFLWTE